jgi:hypothetical protein
MRGAMPSERDTPRGPGRLRHLAVTKRVHSGRLHPKHRGVFAVGTPLLPPLGRERAALLAVDGTVLARGSSAAVLGVLAAHPSGPVELLTTSNRRSRPGIVVHRTRRLPPEDVRIQRGLPVTSPARTVLDLAAGLSTSALERLLAEVTLRDPGPRTSLRPGAGGGSVHCFPRRAGRGRVTNAACCAW